MATKKECMDAAVKAGATPQEARDIVENIFTEAKRAKAKGKNAGLEHEIARQIMEQADAERVHTMIQRKHTALVMRRRVEVEDAIKTMQGQGASLDDALTALLVGSTKRFDGARDSVSRRRVGIRNEWVGGMVQELDEIEGAISLLTKDREFSTTVHREMMEPNSSSDPVARQVAGIFTRYLEETRIRANDAGANIGKLENYAPQSHNEVRMLRAGEVAWSSKADTLLDWKRSFPGITDTVERQTILAEIYTNLVTGQSRKTTGQEMGLAFTPPRNLASGLGKERVLHFKNADAALEYHAEFGQGSIVQAVLGQIDRASGRVSLMEVFGPTPEVMIKSLIDGEARRLRSLDPDTLRSRVQGKAAKKLDAIEQEILAARKRGDVVAEQTAQVRFDTALTVERGKLINEAKKLWQDHRSGSIGTYYAVLAGETGTPVNPTAAKIGANLRSLQSMAKLGGATLSAFADVFVKAVNLRHNGENLLDAWRYALDIRLEVLQTHEKKQFARSLGLYANTLMSTIATRFDAPDAPSGVMTRWMNTFFKFSGLEAWTEGHKAAYTMHLSSMLGDATKGDGFGKIQKDFAATLRRHGLDTRWSLIEKMAKQEMDGHRHVLPERAYDLSDADVEGYLPERLKKGNAPVDPAKRELWAHARLREQEKIRRDTATSVMGFYADETRYAVLEPDEKTRAIMLGNSQPGTAHGEIRRFITQFKSFPVSYMQRFMGETRWNRASMRRGQADMPGMIHAIAGGLAFGYLAMSAKDIMKGRSTRDTGKLETWIAAALQSGGLGILGDFFLGTHDRFGGQAAGNLLGPMLTNISKVLPITGQLARGEYENAAEDALRLTLDNTPYINLWYTRAALDYLLLYHIREALSPGTLKRTERRIQEEFNQTYLNVGGMDFTPSKVIKKGGGFK